MSHSDDEDKSNIRVDSSVPEIQLVSFQLNKNPSDASLWFQRGMLLYELQKYEEASRDLERSLSLDSSKTDTWHLLADAYLDNLQSRKALEIMEQVAVMFPDSLGTLLKLSEFQLILRQYSGAFQTINRIQNLDADNADAFFMKGMVLKEIGDTLQAISQFQEATKTNPRLVDAWINLGQLMEAQNNKDAIRYFDAGLAANRDNHLLLHAKAQFLGRSDQIEAAKSLYRVLIDINPLSADTYYDLGLLFLDQDSTMQAQKHFDLAIKIDPTQARTYFYRGWTHEILGDIEAARNDYQQALRFNREDSDAAAGLERIDS